MINRQTLQTNIYGIYWQCQKTNSYTNHSEPKMKTKLSKIVFSIILLGISAADDEECKIVTLCSTDLEQRLSTLEGIVKAQQLTYAEDKANLEKEIFTIKDQNKNLLEENTILRSELNTFKTNFDEVESVILPWKIPSSCQEYADRGVSSNGTYPIRPSLTVNSFEVQCLFRE